MCRVLVFAVRVAFVIPVLAATAQNSPPPEGAPIPKYQGLTLVGIASLDAKQSLVLNYKVAQQVTREVEGRTVQLTMYKPVQAIVRKGNYRLFDLDGIRLPDETIVHYLNAPTAVIFTDKRILQKPLADHINLGIIVYLRKDLSEYVIREGRRSST